MASRLFCRLSFSRWRAFSLASLRLAPNGGFRVPSSVMMPVRKRAGVTSKAGLNTCVPSGAIDAPPLTRSISSELLSSMTMSWPVGMVRSMVEVGTHAYTGMPCACAAIARLNVPILLATSPLAATLSAPKTTASTLPWYMRRPLAPSTIRWWGILLSRNSQHVNLAPCSRGLVSSTYTWRFLPAWLRLKITPRAVPWPAVARAPVLQWWIRFSRSAGPLVAVAPSVLAALDARMGATSWSMVATP
mmetsp:Transcript_31394/g.77796  ORF Transcript_31394/g.77796 Transcript_31394/m.77796 type:complete len:246 (+) Transcript_31394:793-1530(+)